MSARRAGRLPRILRGLLRPARRRGIGTAAAVVLLSTALVAQNGVATDAAWNDAEWTRAGVGASDCATADDAFATRGEGRVLSGSLLGSNLDSAAKVAGVTVTNDTSDATSSGGTPVSGVPDAWSDPLDATALGLVNANLTGLLQLPVTTAQTGAVRQFGQARSTGLSVGAAGYVTDGGGINLDGAPGGYPELASLNLQQLLSQVNPAAAASLTDIAGVSLRSGAVAGRARLDGCGAAWASDITELSQAVTREYLASDLALEFTSPTVGALVTRVGGSASEQCGAANPSVLKHLECTVNGLTSNSGLVTGILSGLTGLLGSLLNGLAAPTVAVKSASIDLSIVRSLLDDTIGDGEGIVSVDLSTGRIRVDTAALLGSAYDDGRYAHGLNGLGPNTQPLRDAEVSARLGSAIAAALTGWLADVETAIGEAVDLLRIEVEVKLKLTIVLIVLPVSVTITASIDGTLSELEAGKLATVTVDPLNALNGLVNGLVSGLTSGLGKVVAAAVRDIVNPLFTALPAKVENAVALVGTTLTGAYDALFLSGIVSLTANAQNDPFSGGPEPPEWQGLPEGRYDVAALRIGVLDGGGALGSVLYLGRGSVGRTCTAASAAAGECSGY